MILNKTLSLAVSACFFILAILVVSSAVMLFVPGGSLPFIGIIVIVALYFITRVFYSYLRNDDHYKNTRQYSSDKKGEKYIIKGHDIRIAHEIVSVLGEDGKTMRTESVQSFARTQLLRHYKSLDDFIQTWTEAERKQAIMDELKEYSILIDAVRESNPALKDADIFDVICHVAFDQKPLTRKERANNVKKRNYFGKYEGKAREVLEALLDKYAENGILDFEKANILEIPPFNSIGKPTKIIKLFGGIIGYEKAVRELEYQIYKSA